MKKLITIIALLIIAQVSVSAKCFDAVFNRFKSVENANYVIDPNFKMEPFHANELSTQNNSITLPMDLDMELSGMKTISLENCSEAEQQKFHDAVMEAGKKCEMLVQAKDNDTDICIWLEPKKAKKFKKMIWYSKNKDSLVEFSGKFSF